jgi:transcriptional regulator with XRE-family HTH domain
LSTPHYQQALGRKIAAERRRRGLSQPELARMIDRSVAWVSQVERGVRKVDRMSVLEILAAALDVPLAELAAEAPVVAAVTEEPPDARGLRLVLSRGPCLARHAQRPSAARTRHAPQQSPPGVGPNPRRALHRPDRFAARPDP